MLGSRPARLSPRGLAAWPDLSPAFRDLPDDRYLVYFAHKPGAAWEHGETYVALSKLPWLTPRHAFGTGGTWTRGYHFTEDGVSDLAAEADLPIPYGLRATSTLQFANERRRGWVEAADSPARAPDDLRDQRRNARLFKPQPGGQLLLRVESLGWAGGEFGREQAVDGLRVAYALESGEDLQLLADVQWADWDRDGRLLVATRPGQLQVRRLHEAGSEIIFAQDLAPFTPAPAPPPAWAQSW